MTHTDVAVRRQILAIVALVSLLLLAVIVVLSVIQNLWAFLLAVVGLSVAALGAWWAITEQAPRRWIGLGVGLLGVLVVGIALARGVESGPYPAVRALVALALAGTAAWSARQAVVSSLHEADLARLVVPFHPKHPVLLANPWSGGGKVDKFELVAKAQALGVEVVLLDHGLDLEQLARDAVARGADCLGMAGGDGSQALVASIAVEHGLPFVCISAGTRNHFALDLGLDREDPSTGLAAFSDGVIRQIDYATVGSRLFVNNVSLGVYAQIVEQDEYRDAKVETTMESLPVLLGRAAEPYDLQFTTPDGAEVDGSFVILVSNNPYVLGPALDVSQRRSLTTGELGIFAINTRSGRDAAALVARSALGRAVADPNLHQFTSKSFQVRSRCGTADAGIDGEALKLATPLDFTIHPRGLAVLVPKDNPASSLARHYRSFGVAGLWAIAQGRNPQP